MREYEVARATARDALAVLRHEGLAVSRPGAGVFVSSPGRIVRDSTGRYSRARGATTPPFRSDTVRAGRDGTWEHASREVTASPDVAGRLGIAPGDPVMETRYRFFADDRAMQLSRSWEPLAITRGTPVERPEQGPIRGVIARMDHIGRYVDHVVEKVTARAATPDEIAQLDLPRRGAYVLVIDRTHLAGDLPVETCDITFPGDRYQLTYAIPVPG
jgi:GntR family transcriptional regulator